MGAEETLRTVVIGVFNDFLDGDLEMVRTLLRKFHESLACRANETFRLPGGINDLSPSLRLGDEGIESILLTLQGLRDRVLSMCILTNCIGHALTHLLTIYQRAEPSLTRWSRHFRTS
jgi:hypothetical protein